MPVTRRFAGSPSEPKAERGSRQPRPSRIDQGGRGADPWDVPLVSERTSPALRALGASGIPLNHAQGAPRRYALRASPRVSPRASGRVTDRLASCTAQGNPPSPGGIPRGWRASPSSSGVARRVRAWAGASRQPLRGAILARSAPERHRGCCGLRSRP